MALLPQEGHHPTRVKELWPSCVFSFTEQRAFTLGISLDFAIYLGIKSVYASFTWMLVDKGRTTVGLHCPECPQPHAMGEPELQSSGARDWGGRRAWPWSTCVAKAGARCHLEAGPPVGVGGSPGTCPIPHRLSTLRAGCDADARRPS